MFLFFLLLLLLLKIFLFYRYLSMCGVDQLEALASETQLIQFLSRSAS